MTKKILAILVVPVLMFANIAIAKGSPYFVKIIGQKEINSNPLNLVVLTQAKNERDAKRAKKSRVAELEDLGWTVVGTALSVGELYDKKYQSTIKQKPASVSYLAFNDSKDRKVRINLGNKDGMTAVGILNDIKEEYLKHRAWGLRVIPSPSRTYVNEKMGFSIDVPGNFSVREAKFDNKPLILILAARDDQSDSFSENINIAKADSNDLELAAYVQILNDQTATRIENYKVLYVKNKSHDDREFIEMQATGLKDGRRLKYHGWYTQQGTNFYMLTFASEESRFDEYMMQIGPMLDSFKVL